MKFRTRWPAAALAVVVLATAGSGGITVRLSSEAAFDLYARTSSRSISTDHPLTVQGTIKRRELRGEVGGGGYLVDMRTGSGSISIE